MQSTNDKLVGRRLREVTDFGLAVAVFLLLVAIVGYYKMADWLKALFG
jgi:hypothetical protein